MRTKVLKGPEHYLYLAFLTSLAYVFFMKFIFQEVWGYSPFATELVEGMSSIVPMIRYLKKWHEYRAYWGIFYSIFWIISPIFLALGFLATRVLDEKYLTAYKKQSKGKFYLAGFAVFCFCAFLFIVPGGGNRFWLNELSDNLIIISITLLQMAGCIFGLGFFIGVARLKLN